MTNLERIFSRTFKPFYLFTGAGTALVGIFAFFPSWAMPNIVQLPYMVEYAIIIQHWGIMVVIYTIGYFAYCGFDFPVKDQPDRQG